jgi:tetratricopeptide (TPR) repeat protein
MNAKQPDKAVTRIDAVAARYPNNAAVHDLRAQVLMASRRFEPAVAAGEQAIKLMPTWWQAYRTLAMVHFAENKPDAAMAVYERGIKATNGASQLVVDYAQQQERLGHVDVAIRAYEDWLKREPHSDVAANNLAMLLVTHKGTDAAALKRALQLTEKFQTSNNAAFVDTLGWVHYLRGEFNEAVPPLQRAVDLAPRAVQLRAHLGLAQYKANQHSAAKGNLELAAQQTQGFPELDAAKKALAELQAKQ